MAREWGESPEKFSSVNSITSAPTASQSGTMNSSWVDMQAITRAKLSVKIQESEKKITRVGPRVHRPHARSTVGAGHRVRLAPSASKGTVVRQAA